jgi:Xaa-Pro aminopeptidase
MNFDHVICQKRRQELLKQMQHGIAIVPTAPEVARNADTHFSYRHDSNFYYLTGFTEPEAVLVLVAGDDPRAILLPRKKSRARGLGWPSLWSRRCARTVRF